MFAYSHNKNDKLTTTIVRASSSSESDQTIEAIRQKTRCVQTKEINKQPRVRGGKTLRGRINTIDHNCPLTTTICK